MTILAISLCQTDTGEGNDQTIYVSKLAAFEYEMTAQEFAKDKPHISLIDTDLGEIIKTGILTIEAQK